MPQLPRRFEATGAFDEVAGRDAIESPGPKTG